MSDKNPVWLVAYTLPKTEKKVHEKLKLMGITSLLPLVEKVQIWSDRKKKVQFPLFPNYIFIETHLSKRFEPLKLKELVRYISFGGEVAQVRKEEIEMLKLLGSRVNKDVLVLNEAFNQKGLPVKIIEGPLTGLRGIVEHLRGKQKLLIKIHSLRQAISLEVSADMIVRDTEGEHVKDMGSWTEQAYRRRLNPRPRYKAS